jgi:MFS family permease
VAVDTVLIERSGRDEDRDAGARLAFGGVLLLAFGHFLAFVDRALPGVYAPSLKAGFGLSDTQLGALQGPAFVLFYVSATLLAGSGAIRLRANVLLAGSVIVWTAAAVGFALAPDYPSLFASRLLLGLGEAAFAPTALAVLASETPRRRLSQAVSIFTAGSATGRSGAMLLGGAALALMSGGAIAGLAPWRAASLALVLPNLLVALALLHRPGAQAGSAPARAGGLAAATRRLLSAPGGLGLHFLAGAGTVLMVQAAGAWAPSILHRAQGLDPAGAALAAGVVVLAGAPAGHLTGGRLMDLSVRSGRGPAAILTAGAVSAALGAAGLAAAPDLGWALACLFLVVAGGGAAAAAALAGLQPLIPRGLGAGVNSLFLAASNLVGFGLGPLLTGVLSDRLFPGPRGAAVALAVVTAVAAAATALAALAGARGWRRLAEAT